MKQQRIIQRLASIFVCAMGWFCTTGCSRPSGDDHPKEPAAIKVPADLQDGQTVYDSNCASCHDSSRDGAPRLGYESAWTRRVAQGQTTLVKHAIEGIEMMPARGDNPELTDQQVEQAVRYMMFRAELGIPAKY